VLKQVPARKLSLKPIEELARKIHRYSREEMQAFVLRFAVDFLRLRRELRDAEHLTTCMERINLVSTEQARELSRLNNRLYECVLQDEAKHSRTGGFSRHHQSRCARLDQDDSGSFVTGSEPSLSFQFESA